jgi:putative thioredoxin
MSTDTTIQSFQADVVDASMQVPVVVDFWAPWCGPCKTLGPLLEKLEASYGGAFKLVKIDTDKEQQLATHFRIRSIPTVVAFVGGQPVDQFQGALPEGKLREFIDRLMPNPSDIELEQAGAALERGDQAAAAEHVKRAISLDPANDSARLLYAQLLLAGGDPAAAQGQLDSLSAAAKADPQVAELAAQVAQAVESAKPPVPHELLDSAVELGRACIDQAHRDRNVLFLLFRGLIAYVQHNGARRFFGCSSLTGTDPRDGAALYRRLLKDGRVHPEVRVHALPAYHCPVVELAGDEREVEVPKLFAIYLRYDAFVLGPPAIDREFGTIDFLTWVEATEALCARFG